MIVDPYPRLMVARDQVNQGAALLMMSVESARKLGVPEEKWVYLRGHADMKEPKLLERADIGASPASVTAVNEALRVAGIGLDDVAAFDLYSCFPFPVFNICDGTGLATDDPRGLTLTGGLPFFGGLGNNYSMHGIAEAVNEMRDKPGQFALVGANGGIASKYSVGIYSTEPADWVADNSAQLQAEHDAQPKVAITEKADGTGTIETYTVRYDWTPHTGIIIGRLDDAAASWPRPRTRTWSSCSARATRSARRSSSPPARRATAPYWRNARPARRACPPTARRTPRPRPPTCRAGRTPPR